MKKITFLFVAMLAFCWQSNAQDTCGTATAVTPGTVTGTVITVGTGSAEMAPAGADSAWFVYSATADGTIDVNSCLGGADTDLSIGTGTCGALTGAINNDDACDLGTGNAWASEITGYAVVAGNDYYIEWSNEWSEGPFDWSLSFTPAPACTSTVVDSSTVVDDCVGGTYTVDMVVSTVGDGDVITDGTNDYPVVLGTITAGPYAVGTSVTLDVAHTDGACDFSLGSFSDACPAANDECIDAIAIACAGQYTGDTSNASPEAVDPGTCGTSAGTGGAVWYTFTGANSSDAGAAAGTPGDDVTLDLSLSTFDTKIRVFEGSCGALVCVDGDDDGGTGTTSMLTFTTTVGTDYFVLVHGFSANEGPYTLDVSCVAPPLCVPATFTVANGANNCPTEEFFVDVDVTALGTGASVNISDDGGVVETAVGIGTYSVGPYAAGAVVNITVEDAAGDTCNGTDSITTPATCPPANDECSGAIAVACAGQYTGDTTNANPELDDPGTCGTSAGTAGAVWYSYTGANSNDAGAAMGSTGDEVTLDLSLSTFDTKIRLFSGVCGDLTCVDGDDDGGAGTTSLLTFTATVGTEYYILVHGFSANAGPYTLDVSCVAPPMCMSAVVDSSTIVEDCVAGTFTVDVVVSSVGDGDVITDGTNDYTVVAGTVTAGPYPADGTPVTLDVAHTDGACDFSLGSFEFACPPANDDAAGAMDLTVGDTLCEGKTETSNVGSTLSVETAQSCGGADGSDVWFKVTVPVTGEVTVETSASVNAPMLTDTAMSVYSGTPGSLVELACNDDGGTGLYSLIELTGLTPGDVLYVRVKPFGGATKGNFAICAWSPSTLGIEDNSFEGFSYYPNPVQNELTLKSQIGIENVSIYNIVGQRIMNENNTQTIQNIDMSALQSGTYIVKVSINGQTKTIRVLKE